MTERTMRHALYTVALTVLAWSSSGAPRAAAQAINANATIYVTPEDSDKEEKLENGSNVYISRAQCRGEWRIELQGYSIRVPYLEMWAINNPNTNCADPNNRVDDATRDPVCWKLGQVENANPKATFTLSGSRIFDVDRDGQCDDIMGNKYKIQFVTLDSPTAEGRATVTASNNNPNQVAAIFTMYSKIPDAPNAKSGAGGRRLTLEYSKLPANDPLTEYRAYFERTDGVGGMDGGICANSRLSATTTLEDGGTEPLRGSDLEVDGVNIFQSGTTKGSSLSIGDLDKKGIAVGSYTAAAVAAIDGAGNVGYLSNVICIEREESVGYLEYCADAGRDCGELDSCSLSSRNTGSALLFSACTLAISAWTRRRRRSP